MTNRTCGRMDGRMDGWVAVGGGLFGWFGLHATFTSILWNRSCTPQSSTPPPHTDTHLSPARAGRRDRVEPQHPHQQRVGVRQHVLVVARQQRLQQLELGLADRLDQELIVR